MKMNKKGQANWGLIIVLAVVAILVLSPGTLQNALSGLGATAGTTTTTTGGAVETCSDPSQTFTIRHQDKLQTTNSVTGEYARVFKNGADQGLTVNGGTVTVGFGDKIEAYMSENSSTYYSSKVDIPSFPCKPQSTSDIAGYESIRIDTTPTVTVFNEENGNLNSAADNETINAGEDPTLKIRYISTVYQGWAPKGDMVWVIAINGTEFVEGDTLLIGDGVTSTNAPSLWTPMNVNAKSKAFKVPGCPKGDAKSCDLTLDLKIKAETGTNPADSGIAGSFPINVTVYTENYYMEPTTGKENFGVEDSQAGIQSPGNYSNSFTIFYS